MSPISEVAVTETMRQYGVSWRVWAVLVCLQFATVCTENIQDSIEDYIHGDNADTDILGMCCTNNIIRRKSSCGTKTLRMKQFHLNFIQIQKNGSHI